MVKSTCPLCGKEFEDIIKHFVFVHDIQDMDHLNEELEKAESKKRARKEFGTYVEELLKKKQKGEISAEDYRERTSKWWKEQQ